MSGHVGMQDTPTSDALALADMRTSELESIFLRGCTPQRQHLAGWEFRGINVPAWARLAGIKKFIKGFFVATDGSKHRQLMGYNTPVTQGVITEPWRTSERGSVEPVAPKRFGFYAVDPVDASAIDNAYLHAVLLNYGRGGNARFDPTAGLRDYLVQVDAANPNLYLGKAYYALGPLRLATNFFVLERFGRGVDTGPCRGRQAMPNL